MSERARGPGRPGPMVGGEKPKSFGTSLGKLFHYLDRYKLPLIMAIVLAAVGTALILIGPNVLSDITDLVRDGLAAGSIDLEKITSLAIFLVFVYSISFVLNTTQNYIMATISNRTAERLRTDVSKKINRLPLRYFDRSSTGDVLSRATNDIDTVGQSMNQSIGTMISAVVLLLGSMIMMAITNLTMMATAVLSSIAGFFILMLIMRRSQKQFNRQQANLGAMNGHVEEMYSNHLIVKAYNGTEEAKSEFDHINKGLFESAFKSQFMSGLMMPLMMFIGNFGYVMVCIVGAVLCLNGSISIGVIVAFMIYVRLFTQPLQQISQAFVSVQSMVAASERVFEFLGEEELPEESGKTAKIADVKGDVEFRDVRFGYVPDKEVIHGFSAKVSAGQKVAIVGPTGAGKTTIVNLLMRFYEVNSGDIIIDGVSIKDMKREDVHDLFCMVLQDTWVFEGTIRENIAYSKEGVTDEQIEEACKAVGIHHFIKTIPDGYNAILSDKTTISMGQRQQITIARAIIEDSPLLILDEATSSVDTRTEKVIQDAMDSLTEGRTSFVIAHRLSTIRNSDMIIVMKEGDIVEHGTHDELLARGGFYSELYNSQFEEVEE